MRTEIEARFRAEHHAVLPRIAGADRLGRAVLGPPRTVGTRDRYLDTADGALAAARWACRLRTREGRTIVSLKGPALEDDEAWLHRRPELEGPASEIPDPAAWPPSAARGLVDRLRDGRPLVERFALRQRRTERDVLLDGTRLGTLSLDEVAVERAARRLGDLEIVELELAGSGADARAALAELAAELAAIDGLVPEPRTKLEHALALLDD